MSSRVALPAARALKLTARRAGTLGSRAARALGMPTGTGRFLTRLHATIDNATLRERLERGELSAAKSNARLEGFAQTVERVLSDVDDPGDYLEFGVYFGRSLAMAHHVLQRLHPDRARCIGFDSFAGMPRETEDESSPWVRGQYRSDKEVAYTYLAKAGVDLSQVRLVAGWFSDTLRPETAQRLGLRKVGIAMMDCDICSSTRLALDFCEPLIVDVSYIFFDDWSAKGIPHGEGQQKAFHDFLARHPGLSADYIDSYSSDSAVFRLARVQRSEDRARSHEE